VGHNGGVRWFNAKTHDDVVADLQTHRGGASRVLAHASGPDAEVLCVVDALALRRAGEWTLIEWQMVQSGGWKGERSRLEWQLADQSRGHVVLDDPGRVPEVFQERVNASIIIQQGFDVPGGGRVMIAGRRSLVPGEQDRPLVWQAVAQGKAKLPDPQVRQFVLDATASLRADYEF